ERIFQRFYRVQDEQNDGAVGAIPCGEQGDRKGSPLQPLAGPQATDQNERAQSGGSGLGLAAARATVEAHGGKIWAASAGLGEGRPISFTLPFVPPAVKSAPATLAVTEQASTISLPGMQADAADRGRRDSALRLSSPVCVPRATGLPYRPDQRISVLLAEN